MKAEKAEKNPGPGYLERVFDFVSSQRKEANLLIERRRANMSPRNRRDLDSMLIRSVYEGNEDEVSRLLKAGADPNAVTLSGFTVLMTAAWYNRIGIGRMLIQYGAKVKEPDKLGWTAFMLAIQKGHNEFAQMLVSNGADPNQVPELNGSY